MQGLDTNNAPSVYLIIPHYLTAACSFLIAGILLLFSSADLLGHYFNPALLALTHLLALGFGTMIITGALYQLVPVIFQNKLYSEKLGYISFVLLFTGILVLVSSLWVFATGIFLQSASILLGTGILFFMFNIFKTASGKGNRNISAAFILTALIWLGITTTFGIIMSFNFSYQFLSESHLLYLKMHAHTGIAGWFLLLIIGVSSKMLPMFMLSHKPSTGMLTASFFLINAGLILINIDWFCLNSDYTVYLGSVIGFGIIAYLVFIYKMYKNRARKQLETEMKFSIFAIKMMLLPLIFGITAGIFAADHSPAILKVSVLYGVSIFLGAITALILGQTFKTLPFIVWLHKYKKMIGKGKTPLPKDLYRKKLLVFQFITYFVGFMLVLSGIVFSNLLFIQCGSLFFVFAGIAYNINVFKIVFHKAQFLK